MSRDNALANGALTIFGSVIALMLLEVCSRVYLAAPIAMIPRYGNSFHAIFVSGIVYKTLGSDLPWELKADLNVVYKLAEFRTNSRGLRADREFTFRKPAGTYRVAVIGDSFTMPSGVPIEDAYHSVLERALNQESERQFEFLNFGVGAYSLANYLTVLNETALGYRPDHVLVGFYIGNDIPQLRTEPPRRLEPKPWGGVLFAKNPFYSYWTLDLLDRARPLMSSARPLPKKVYDLAELDRLLAEFRRVRDERHLDMTFAILRLESSSTGEDFAIVTHHMAKHGLMQVDAGSEFESSVHPRYQTTRLDQHPNAAAHQNFATSLMREIGWEQLSLRTAMRQKPRFDAPSEHVE